MKKLRICVRVVATLFVLFLALPASAESAFEMTGTTLIAYSGSDTTVIVPEGVTAIGEKAFYQNTDVQNVTLPSTLTHIAPSAFEGCTALETINFPSGLIDIQNAAFKDCVSLQTASLSRGLSALGAQAFYNCMSLTDVTAYAHLGTIGAECFRYCDALTIRCPEGAFIGGYAAMIGADTETFTYTVSGDFVLDGSVLVRYTGSDSAVTLSEGITEIGAYAFEGNTNITRCIPLAQLVGIQPYAFAGCENLAEITPQTQMQSLGAFAFSGCSNLTDISLLGTYAVVPQGAFSGCSILSAVALPESTTVFDDFAFSSCDALADLPAVGSLTGIGGRTFAGCGGLTSVALPDTVEWLGEGAFVECTQLSEFSFPQNMKKTGDKTLRDCTALRSVNLPYGFLSVGAAAFDGCTQLTGVILPESLTLIGANAFRNTGLIALTLPETLSGISDQAFYGALKGVTVFVPATVTAIGSNAFGACENLIIQCGYQSAAFEYAVSNGIDYELIGDTEDPFLIDNGELIRYFGVDTAVSVPEEVTVIGAEAFKNKAAITSVALPGTLSEIKNGAFEGCRSLSGVVLPEALALAGEKAFKDCTGLTEIVVLGTNTVFAEDAFLNVENFTAQVYFGSNADAYFSALGKTMIYLSDNLPVETVVLDDLPKIILGDNGITVSGVVEKHGLPAPNADFRMSYKAEEEVWWTFVSTEFLPCEENGSFSHTISLLQEGTYRFRVEAKTRASNATEIETQSEPAEIFIGAFPAKRISALVAGKDALKAGEDMTLIFETETDMDGQAVQTSVEYSRDGITWLQTGSEWSEPVALVGSGGQVIFTLPEDLPEGEYTFRLSLRAAGRETADTTAECTASVYRVMPVRSVALAVTEDVLVVPPEGLALTASAQAYPGYAADAEFCFYYAYNGGAFVRFRTWGSNAAAVFKPAAEGEYILKVAARSIGRTGVDTEYISNKHTVYLGAVPAHGLAVTLGKDSFEYGEPIKLSIMLTEGRVEQITRYQVQYKKSGTSRYLSLSNWQEYALNEGQTSITENVLIPSNRLDLAYQIKVAVRTDGRKGEDVSQTQEINLHVGEPLSSVTLMPLENPTVQGEQGVGLQAVAQKQDETKANAEYRFAFKPAGTSRWRYASKRFSYIGQAAVIIKKEGVYDFRVEAKAAGSAEVQAVDEVLGIQVYHGAIPAQAVSAAIQTGETEYLENEPVTLNVIGTPCGDERYNGLEYSVLYSTNGRRFKTLPGYDFGEYDGTETIVLPQISKDTVCYLKAAVRTEERTGTDAVSETLCIRRYMIFPLDAVSLNASGENPQAISSEAGIILSAQGFRRGEKKPSAYRFGYRLAGTAKWRYIGKAFTETDSVAFVPRMEGEYEFCVQARTQGRTTVDAVSFTSVPVGLYFIDLPAVSAGLDFDGKTQGLYSESIPLTISAAGNGKEGTELEYQVLISANNRRFKPLPEYEAYQPLVLTNGTADINIRIAALRDRRYYIRVNVRTKGRAGADVWATQAIDMYTVMPLKSVMFDEIIKDENGRTILSARAAQTEGYENYGYVPLYRFYYRVSGTSRWRAITGYSESKACLFAPGLKPYDFKVRAVNSGRRGFDVEDIIYNYQADAQ